MTVDGPRFHAFMPLGSKALLEHEIFLLARAHGWDPPTVMKMPCSQRHRFVKMDAEATRQQNMQARGQTAPAASSIPTGISNATTPKPPGNRGTTGPQQAVNLDYPGI